MICIKKTAILTLSLATTWSAAALAQPPSNGPQPPPEAYTACAGKQPGEKASFMNPQGHTITGTCERQRDGRLLLRPDHLGGGRGNGIPPQAYQDCVGKKLGDPVRVTTPDGRTISGSCQSDGERLYMRPDGPPSPPPSMNNGMRPQNGPRNASPEDTIHDGQQYREPRTENTPSDTWQQSPAQEAQDSSSGYQQQSPLPEDRHTGTRQQRPEQEKYDRPNSTPQQQEATQERMPSDSQRPNNNMQQTGQQGPAQEAQDSSSGYQQQSPLPEDRHTGTRQQRPEQEKYDRPNSTPQQQEMTQEGMHSDVQQPDNNIQQQTGQQAQGGNDKPKPPETAYKACEGKSAGDEVQMTTPQGRTITGTCEQDGDRLFLRPNRPAPPNDGSASENNIQQQEQQSTSNSSADQTVQQPQQPAQQPPTQQSVQKPQEKPEGILDKVKGFWQSLW